MSKQVQNHFTRAIYLAGSFILLLSACLGQPPTAEPVATFIAATPTHIDQPTVTPSPGIQELRVADWQILSFTCDKNGMLENVIVEVTAEGGTLPYVYSIEGIVESNAPATKHVPPADTQTKATPAKKPQNATATPVTPTHTPTPLLLPGKLLINMGPGVENIIIQSADGQSVTLELAIPSACSDLNIPQTTPTNPSPGIIVLTSTPQPGTTPTATLNLPRRPVCSDGLDNDGDGYVDLYDHNCKSKGDQDESH